MATPRRACTWSQHIRHQRQQGSAPHAVAQWTGPVLARRSKKRENKVSDRTRRSPGAHAILLCIPGAEARRVALRCCAGARRRCAVTYAPATVDELELLALDDGAAHGLDLWRLLVPPPREKPNLDVDKVPGRRVVHGAQQLGFVSGRDFCFLRSALGRIRPASRCLCARALPATPHHHGLTQAYTPHHHPPDRRPGARHHVYCTDLFSSSNRRGTTVSRT